MKNEDFTLRLRIIKRLAKYIIFNNVHIGLLIKEVNYVMN